MLAHLVAAVAAGAAPQAAPQETGSGWIAAYAELNGAQAHEASGAELGVGARFSVGPLRVTPTIGTFAYDAGTEYNQRFRQETFSNGNTVCRDLSNGQFADAENCNGEFSVDFAAYGKVELALAMPWGEIGGGRRFSEAGDADFGRIGIYISDEDVVGSRGVVSLMFGGDFVGVGLSIGG